MVSVLQLFIFHFSYFLYMYKMFLKYLITGGYFVRKKTEVKSKSTVAVFCYAQPL